MICSWLKASATSASFEIIFFVLPSAAVGYCLTANDHTSFHWSKCSTPAQVKPGTLQRTSHHACQVALRLKPFCVRPPMGFLDILWGILLGCWGLAVRIWMNKWPQQLGSHPKLANVVRYLVTTTRVWLGSHVAEMQSRQGTPFPLHFVWLRTGNVCHLKSWLPEWSAKAKVSPPTSKMFCGCAGKLTRIWIKLQNCPTWGKLQLRMPFSSWLLGTPITVTVFCDACKRLEEARGSRLAVGVCE